jgi:hypothetical protein
MVRNVLAVGVSVVALMVVSLVLAALFRAQVRHYERAVATDLLDDWKLQLELLDPQERERALHAPPANVVAAMAALPSRGLRGDWNVLPAASVTGG